MAPHHTQIGVAFGPHSEGMFCYVLVFAAEIVSKKSKDIGDYLVATKEDTSMFTDKNWDKFQKDIFDFQNKIRKEPKSFIPHLQKVSKRFQGLKMYNEQGT